MPKQVDFGEYNSNDAETLHTTSDISVDNLTGDLILFWIVVDGQRTITTPTGFTLQNGYSGNGISANLYSRVTTSDNETIPDTTIASVDSLSATVLVLRGVHASTPIANITTNTGTTQLVTWSAQTVSNDESLVVYFGGMDADGILLPGLYKVSETDIGAQSQCCGWDWVPTATTLAAKSRNASATDGWRAISCEIVDNVSTPTRPEVWFPNFPANPFDSTNYTEDYSYRDALHASGKLLDGGTPTALTFDGNTDALDIGTGSVDSGTSVNMVTNVLTDSGKSWTTNEHKGRILYTSVDSEYHLILSNTATTITVYNKDQIAFDKTGTDYTIYHAAVINIPSGLTTSHDSVVFRLQANGNTPPTGLTDGAYYFLVYVDSTTATLLPSTDDQLYYESDVGFDYYVQTSATGSGTITLDEVKVAGQSITFRADGQDVSSIGHYGKGYAFTTPVDISNVILSYTLRTVYAGYTAIRITVIDSSNNWKTYKINDDAKVPIEVTGLIDVANTDKEEASSGSFDATDLKYIIYTYERISYTARPDLYPYTYNLLTDVEVALGTSGDPVTWKKTFDLLQQCITGSSKNESVLQYIFNQGIAIGGDGTHDTYFTDSNKGIAFPAPSDGVTDFRYYTPNLGFEIYGSSSSVISLRNHQIGANSNFPFTINASDASEPTLDGSIFVNATFTMQSDDVIDGSIFSGGGGITHNDGTLTNCTFSNIDRAAGYLVLSTTHNISDCTFKTDTAGDYAIEIDTAGDYELDGITFTGFTTDINVTETTGTVNINIVGGGDIPTITTAGATINVTQNVSITAENLVDDTRVQLYNVTKDAELDNSVVSGGSGYSYSADLQDAGIDDGDTIRLRATYQSGTSAKKELNNSGIVTTIGLSFLNTQTDDSVYNSYGVDGSGITEFSWDNPNLEIDIDDPDNVTVIQRVGAWYSYYITTADGIRNLFGCIDWESLNSIKILASVCNLKLDNVDAVNPLFINGGRIYRDDDATVIATSSGSIQMDYDPVYVTGVESTDIADAVWDGVIVGEDRPNGSAGDVVKNLPKLITKRDDL